MEIKKGLEKGTLEEQVEAVFDEMIKIPEVAEALKILDELPEDLTYHNKKHTLDVIKETILFALADGADSEVLRQQVIAAAWHDVGYARQRADNEPVAVEMFQKSNAFQNLSKEKRNEIIANIFDTQVVMKENSPYLLRQKSSLGYILDADVSNFGRKDFFEKSQKIAEELGINLSDLEAKKEFFRFTIALLQNHQWKTESARFLRQAQKEENLQKLIEEYKALGG